MPRTDFNNLQAFTVVARERSFTRAAAQLGVSQSALSHTIRTLEAKLGVRLLTRTTRGVSPTELGRHLLLTLAPHYAGIEAEMAAMSKTQGAPAGNVRITADQHVVDTILWPKLFPLMLDYPEIRIEISVNYGMIDIVSEQFDGGVRLGDQVAKDMIAVRLAPDMRMAVTARRSYLNSHELPKTPNDLTLHNCINLRLPTYGGLYAWEFMQHGQTFKVHVTGQFVGNTSSQLLAAVMAGIGIGYTPFALVEQEIASGELIPLLEDWWPTFPGYHFYYPSRLQSNSAIALVVDTLRLKP